MIVYGRFLALVSSATLVAAMAGCGRTEVTDYVPAGELAKDSLVSALEAWKAGRPPEEIGATAPAIQVQDSGWKAGKKLAGYEILGTETGPDQNLRFRVRLSMAGAKAPEEVVYVVVGKDPIWIFNQADYEKVSGM